MMAPSTARNTARTAPLLLLLALAPFQLASKGCEVATVGEDSAAIEACGGLEGATCDGAEYCQFAEAAQCGAADMTGVCTPKPEACDDSYDPVCGCDGVTYDNECSANAAATSLAARGPCEPAQAESCGGLTGEACPEGQYCTYPDGDPCGAADASGTCVEIPVGCATSQPVCGCDGVTYADVCVAAAAGTPVAAQGECL